MRWEAGVPVAAEAQAAQAQGAQAAEAHAPSDPKAYTATGAGAAAAHNHPPYATGAGEAADPCSADPAGEAADPCSCHPSALRPSSTAAQAGQAAEAAWRGHPCPSAEAEAEVHPVHLVHP